MITSIDKAIQDFVVSSITLGSIYWPQVNGFKEIGTIVGVAFLKAVITWAIPNKR